MLNKLFLLLFWTYVTTTFLYYLSLTKLKIHQIQNDCTNQSITDKQIQVWIKQGRDFFLGGGWKRTAMWETIKSFLQSGR